MRPLVDAVPALRRICEAADAARHSVWLTVAFHAPDFQMPDGGGALFDVLDRAVERGLDVRVIFWRPNQESIGYGRAFAGTPEERDMLVARGSRFRIRWDRAPGSYCHHQKSWLIDAGQASETVNASFEALYASAADRVLNGTGREAFDAIKMLKTNDPLKYDPEHGADYPRSPFGQALKQIAQLTKSNVGLEVAFADVGGWDTHVNQGAGQGQLAGSRGVMQVAIGSRGGCSVSRGGRRQRQQRGRGDKRTTHPRP